MTAFFDDDQRPPASALLDIEEFLVNAPLYRALRLDIRARDGASTKGLLPWLISRGCEFCKQTTRWDRQSEYGRPGNFIEARYKCRNCERREFFVWFYWGQPEGATELLKVGQSPRLEIEPRPELATALDASQLQLYKTGMIMRNNNY